MQTKKFKKEKPNKQTKHTVRPRIQTDQMLIRIVLTIIHFFTVNIEKRKSSSVIQYSWNQHDFIYVFTKHNKCLTILSQYHGEFIGLKYQNLWEQRVDTLSLSRSPHLHSLEKELQFLVERLDILSDKRYETGNVTLNYPYVITMCLNQAVFRTVFNESTCSIFNENYHYHAFHNTDCPKEFTNTWLSFSLCLNLIWGRRSSNLWI